jgi:hypothetical protein
MRHDALNLLTRAIELKPFSLRALAVFSNNHQAPFAAYQINGHELYSWPVG